MRRKHWSTRCRRKRADRFGGLRFPKIPATDSVFHDGAVRHTAEIEDLVGRIGALIESRRIHSATERKTTTRAWPIPHRVRLINGRANKSARVRADDGANRSTAHVTRDRSTENGARNRTPPRALPRSRVAGRECERCQQPRRTNK